MTQGQYVGAAYGAVFVVVLVYVAIIAAKLARLQRQLGEIVELAHRRLPVVRVRATPTEPAGEPL